MSLAAYTVPPEPATAAPGALGHDRAARSIRASVLAGKRTVVAPSRAGRGGTMETAPRTALSCRSDS